MATETPNTSSGLTRYHITARSSIDLSVFPSATPSPHGDWCRYSDAAAIEERCQELIRQRDERRERHAQAVFSLNHKNDLLRDRVEQLETALMEADTDIFHWVQLAKRQQRELPDVDHLPCGPTTNGIEASEKLRQRIRAALSEKVAE